MRGDGKDKHKVCLRASTPYISPFCPIYPLALAHFPYPLFHTYAWALLCTQFVQIGYGLAVECLASEKKWPPSAFPALLPGIPSIRPHTHTYHTHTYHTHTHWNTCSYANSKPNYKFASWPHIKTFNSIWKAFYYSNFGQRSLRVCPFALCPYICPSGGLSVCVCLGKSLVRDTCA